MKSNLNNTLVALVAAIFATAPTPQASAQDKLTLAGLAVTPASEQNICIGKDGTARDVSMSTFQVTSNADEDLTVDSISVFINCAGSVSRISPDTLKVFEGAT
ncbi:MAG: hypothetical protein WCO09_02455, partial [bacterium]